MWTVRSSAIDSKIFTAREEETSVQWTGRSLALSCFIRCTTLSTVILQWRGEDQWVSLLDVSRLTCWSSNITQFCLRIESKSLTSSNETHWSSGLLVVATPFPSTGDSPLAAQFVRRIFECLGSVFSPLRKRIRKKRPVTSLLLPHVYFSLKCSYRLGPLIWTSPLTLWNLSTSALVVIPVLTFSKSMVLSSRGALKRVILVLFSLWICDGTVTSIIYSLLLLALSTSVKSSLTSIDCLL